MRARAYSYVRFSTRDQIHGDSRRRQTEAAKLWCQRNKVKLVEEYQDLGVSAFKGRNAETGALAEFLELVRAGRIPKGSYLIVESLDRVSRAAIMPAFRLFMSIIEAGVIVVTLGDGQVYDASAITGGNFTPLVISLAVMSRAHEESRMKSLRIGAAWEAKRRGADKQPMTARCVAWLRLSADRKRFEIIPERAAVVRRIYEMVRQGKGQLIISKTLRAEKIPMFGRGRVWHTSYVKKILDNRAVIGEFTPAKLVNGERVFGEPIPNYYPAVVPKGLFAAVQQIRRQRPSYSGKSSYNAFVKLAFDPDGRPVSYVNKNRKRGWHYLVSSAARYGAAPYKAWPYDDFLSRFLFFCQKAALRKPPERIAVNHALDAARLELDDTEKQIARLVDFLSRGASTSVEAKLRALEARRAGLRASVSDMETDVFSRPKDMASVNWRNKNAFRDNLRATVKRITIDVGNRTFWAEFLDGRVYGYRQENGRVFISSPDQRALSADSSTTAPLAVSARSGFSVAASRGRSRKGVARLKATR